MKPLGRAVPRLSSRQSRTTQIEQRMRLSIFFSSMTESSESKGSRCGLLIMPAKSLRQNFHNNSPPKIKKNLKIFLKRCPNKTKSKMFTQIFLIQMKVLGIDPGIERLGWALVLGERKSSCLTADTGERIKEAFIIC